MRKSDHAYAKARRLRKESSLPEGLLWRELRARKGGVKIRRQHPVGRYVIDSFCAAAKLGIEIDGIAHEMGDRPERDAARDAFLAEQGIEVVRLPASDVLADYREAAETIVTLGKDRID